jgi:hypothetical protein
MQLNFGVALAGVLESAPQVSVLTTNVPLTKTPLQICKTATC